MTDKALEGRHALITGGGSGIGAAAAIELGNDGAKLSLLGRRMAPIQHTAVRTGGTAFQCDVGMTGPFESIIGRRIDRVMETTLTGRPTEFDVATADVRLCGTIVTADPETGRATAVERLCVKETDLPALEAQKPA